jgi:hypothetical protein
MAKESPIDPAGTQSTLARLRRDLGPLVGRKHLRAITAYLADLRKLYPHQNRILFYDDVVVAYLVAFFNPAIRSLRCIEDASQVPGIRQFLGVEALRRSTLSDANRLFDPAHLQGLIRHVREHLPQSTRHTLLDPILQKLVDQIVCLDGSYFRIAGDVQWALWQRNVHTKGTRRHVRLNTSYCLSTGVAEGVSISGDDGVGEGQAAIGLLPEQDPDDPIEHLYLFDSGVVSFGLLTEILKREDHFLCNLQDQVNFAIEQERELTQKDRAASIQSDRIGRLTGSNKHRPPEGLLREIIVNYIDRHGKPRHIRILTDLLELPAHLIAELYRYRWQIELFFRWLKVHAQFRHLMSFSRNGVTTGFYIAVLAAMLLCIHSQQELDKYALNLFGMVAGGLAEPADVLPILERRARAKRLERERLARRKAQKSGI